MTTWHKSSEKKFGCEHVNKCDVFIDQDGEIFSYNTDWGSPGGEFRWVFSNDLLEGEVFSPRRTYIPCNCRPEDIRKAH